MTSIFLCILIVAGLMGLVEYLFARQDWPKTQHWIWRALCLNGFQILMTLTLGTLIDSFIQQYALFHFYGRPIVGIIAAYLMITFIYYGWHRLRHTGKWWDIFHQIHHSPQRLELLTTFYKHPVEILVNTLLSSFIIYGLFGLDPISGSIVVAITGVAELFYHWNIKTPYWLGFVIQRPESHAFHHKQGHHTCNFSDLPLWDILFGTFYNPKESCFQCGFKDQKELNLWKMFIGRNVL